MSDELPELLTPKEVATVLKVGRSTIQRMDSAGLLGTPVILSGGSRKLKRFRREDIIARIETNGFKVRGVRRRKRA